MPVNKDEVKDVWDNAWASMKVHESTGNLAGYYYMRGVCDAMRMVFKDLEVDVDNN